MIVCVCVCVCVCVLVCVTHTYCGGQPAHLYGLPLTIGVSHANCPTHEGQELSVL